MAITSARGLQPCRMLNGSPYNATIIRAHIPASDSTATFVGDAVKSAGSATSDGIMHVAQAAAGNAILGVVVRVLPSTDESNRHRLASTATDVLIEVGRDVVYAIGEDQTGGALAATDVGSVADLVVGSGDATTGLSGMQIDSSTAATGSSAQLKILGKHADPAKSIGDTDVVWEVLIHESELADSANGV